MWASYGIGLLSVRQGDLRTALPLLERAIGICHEADLLPWFSPIASSLGEAYILEGRIADAMSLLMQAMAGIAATVVGFQTLCRLSIVQARMLASCLEEAHALAERTLAFTREHQERGHEAYALQLLGDIAAHRETTNAEEAEVHYGQALALAEELGMRPLQAHCHRGLGTLYAVMGQREQARTELSTAIALYQSMEMTFWLPQTAAALAQVEGR
jgi:tetratricopeptide (TPR) repeat protein